MRRSWNAKVRVPVLAYHRVLAEKEAPRSPYAVTREQFESHMRYLAEHGFRALTITELRNASKLSGPTVAITFDDGYRDNVETARPVLKSYGLTATFFVITGRIGGDDFMQWQHLQMLLEDGMEVGSHSVHHHALSTLAPEALRKEVRGSVEKLNQRLGPRRWTISFPHGMYDEVVIEACREAGYVAACTSDFGYFSPGGEGDYCIPRLMVKKRCDVSRFSAMLQGDWHYAMRVGVPTRIKQGITRVVGFECYQWLYRQVYGAQATKE